MLIREDPPTKKGRFATDWGLELAPAVNEPGVWFKVKAYETPTVAHQTASRIRKGWVKSLPSGKWEAVSRGLTVYVRFLGE